MGKQTQQPNYSAPAPQASTEAAPPAQVDDMSSIREQLTSSAVVESGVCDLWPDLAGCPEETASSVTEAAPTASRRSFPFYCEGTTGRVLADSTCLVEEGDSPYDPESLCMQFMPTNAVCGEPGSPLIPRSASSPANDDLPRSGSRPVN